MKNLKGNELAFPFETNGPHRGLTKREYCVIQILSAALSRGRLGGDIKLLATDFVKEAIIITDELFKQLEE